MPILFMENAWCMRIYHLQFLFAKTEVVLDVIAKLVAVGCLRSGDFVFAFANEHEPKRASEERLVVLANHSYANQIDGILVQARSSCEAVVPTAGADLMAF